MWSSRILEMAGQIILGDGVTCLIVPRKHMLLWRDAFSGQGWRRLVQWCADHPELTMLAGVAECVLGLVMIRRANRDM
jgi:hypothetical protein